MTADERIERGRARVAGGIAAMIHLSLAMAFVLGPNERSELRAVQIPRVPPSLDIEVENVVEAPPETAPESASLVASAPRGISPVHRVGAESIGPAETVDQGARAISISIGPSESKVALKLAGPNALFYAGETNAPTGEPAPPSAKERLESSIRRDLLDHDRGVGLGPEGPMLTALTNATYGAPVPTRGKATFRATVNDHGDVTSLVLDGSNDRHEAWEEVARVALEALRNKQLRMTSASHGASLRIEVTVANKLPNGQDPGLRVEAFGKTLKEGEGKESTTISILNMPSFRAFARYKTVESFIMAGPAEVRRLSEDDAAKRHMHVEEKRQVRTPGNEPVLGPANSDITIISANPDVSNIGAHPRIIVHTKLLDLKAD